ncbi:uncharacterized protein [Chironomus tepperi]|uniref:uncharacterized protein n=1 Tax=Chironomus tepperi TaxID=113505 RepID=UPI00391F7DCA
MFDSDEDGIITTTQLVSALRALGYNTSRIIIKKIKKRNLESEDGVGKLKFEDFVKFVIMYLRYAFTKDDMIADLRLIDINNDGSITKLELENYLKSLTIPLSNDEIVDAVNAADLNNDGKIDYNEFAAMMCPHDKNS